MSAPKEKPHESIPSSQGRRARRRRDGRADRRPLVNAKVPVVLFDLPAKEGPKNGIVLKAIEG